MWANRGLYSILYVTVSFASQSHEVESWCTAMLLLLWFFCFLCKQFIALSCWQTRHEYDLAFRVISWIIPHLPKATVYSSFCFFLLLLFYQTPLSRETEWNALEADQRQELENHNRRLPCSCSQYNNELISLYELIFLYLSMSTLKDHTLVDFYFMKICIMVN